MPGANIWLNDACPDGQMMFLPIVKNDAASCGRNDAMCSAHARSAHHEAKPRIMPAGRIMFRGGGTHHSPSVLTNTRRMGGFFLSLDRASSYPLSDQKTPDTARAFFGLSVPQRKDLSLASLPEGPNPHKVLRTFPGTPPGRCRGLPRRKEFRFFVVSFAQTKSRSIP